MSSRLIIRVIINQAEMNQTNESRNFTSVLLCYKSHSVRLVQKSIKRITLQANSAYVGQTSCGFTSRFNNSLKEFNYLMKKAIKFITPVIRLDFMEIICIISFYFLILIILFSQISIQLIFQWKLYHSFYFYNKIQRTINVSRIYY